MCFICSQNIVYKHTYFAIQWWRCNNYFQISFLQIINLYNSVCDKYEKENVLVVGTERIHVFRSGGGGQEIALKLGQSVESHTELQRESQFNSNHNPYKDFTIYQVSNLALWPASVCFKILLYTPGYRNSLMTHWGGVYTHIHISLHTQWCNLVIW